MNSGKSHLRSDQCQGRFRGINQDIYLQLEEIWGKCSLIKLGGLVNFQCEHFKD